MSADHHDHDFVACRMYPLATKHSVT